MDKLKSAIWGSADTPTSEQSPPSDKKENTSGLTSLDENKHLDLAFAMDTTGSMHSYIRSAQNSVRKIYQCIMSEQKVDIRLALVEYRDHPPQELSFVTRTNGFTDNVTKMEKWLSASTASGGGDCPEALADAFFQLMQLNWREEATKIVVCISDAPPHGLEASGDAFPNGCPDGHDTMNLCGGMAERGITLYVVGCEPAINEHREFFISLALMTGGTYLPLNSAEKLAAVIIGGAKEQISLQEHLAEVEAEVKDELLEAAAKGVEVDSSVMSKKVHALLKEKNVRASRFQTDGMVSAQAPTSFNKSLAQCSTMTAVRSKYKEKPSPRGLLADGIEENFEENCDDITEYQADYLVRKAAAKHGVKEFLH